MAVSAADLRMPNGPVVQKLFPGTTKVKLDAQLTGYLARAITDSRVVNEPDDTKKDPITRALALHYAFTDVYVRMSAEPLSVNVTEKGSTGYSTEQIRNMRALAQQYLDEAIGLMTVVSNTSQATNNAHVQTKYTW